MSETESTTESTPSSDAAVAVPTPAMSEPVQYAPPPIDITDDRPDGPPRLPALPPLPRTIELRAADRWREQVMSTAGKLGESDPAIAAALSAQATMANGLEALELARQTRDPRKSAAEHLQSVRNGFEGLLREAARRRDVAIAAIDAREQELQREVESRTTLTPSADASEIRQMLQRMDPEKRSSVLGTALDTEDTAILSAVFSGREMTTGISDVTRRSLLRRYEESKIPGLHSLRQGLKESRALVEKSFDDMADLDDKVLGSSQAIDEFHRQVREADSAWFALSRFTGA